jgi:hypothetical protein
VEVAAAGGEDGGEAAARTRADERPGGEDMGAMGNPQSLLDFGPLET